ncbi:MAG: acylphosphatase [Balneola sp.]
MKVTKHILISGRVQGVGFRYFTKNNAVSKEIKGRLR